MQELKEKYEALWHSSSHVLAEAVQELFPNTKFAIGPPIDAGFYYDFDVEKPFTEEDLRKIEKKTRELIARKEEFKHEMWDKEKAIDFFKNQLYKIELIKELEDEMVSIYRNGNFTDLCKGPHVKNSSEIKAFKILKTSGAYWRGNEKNKMLQRIYAISFSSEKELKEWEQFQEEAEKRNHITLGHKLELFSLHNEAPGFPFIKPKGMILWNAILDYWRKEHESEGYELVQTPLIMRKNLWETSGHWDHYKESMYFTEIDGNDFAVKPMNCPGSILIYNEGRHSYKELPMKMAELGIVHRHERSGVLNGLFRVRKFTQDDAHIYCTEEQIEEEVIKIIELTKRMYKTFGFNEYFFELSTKPEKALGSAEIWEKAENALSNALKKKKIEFKINAGDGAFYGPKIDVHIKDAIGRKWQCATIQLDFSMPERFELYYIGEDDKKHRPVMLHRVVLGSVERFMGVLIEHYAGEFPLWLAPVQARIITVNDSVNEFAEKVFKEMKANEIRVELDLRKESVGRKVRDAQLQKIPYLLTIGEKEKESKSIAVRDKTGKLIIEKITDFIKKMKKEIEEKK